MNLFLEKYEHVAIPASNDNYPLDFLDEEFWQDSLPISFDTFLKRDQ